LGVWALCLPLWMPFQMGIAFAKRKHHSGPSRRPTCRWILCLKSSAQSARLRSVRPAAPRRGLGCLVPPRWWRRLGCAWPRVAIRGCRWGG